jgi:hypothetical protein
MPFTPAHVAAVLPLVGQRRPRWVVPSALVIGSMIPDLLYFVPVRSDRNVSHSLTGVVTLDLALGLLLVALWRLVAAPVVRDLSPGRVRAKLPVPPPVSLRAALWAVPCVVLGALTHVVWDSFTHANGWVVEQVPLLTKETGLGLPVFTLAQYGSGLVGCALVLAHALRTPDQVSGPDTEPLTSAGERGVARTLLVVLPLLSGLAFALGARGDGTTTEMLLYIAVVRGVTGLGLTAAAVALWWHLTVRRPDRSTPSGALRDTGV